MSAKQTEACGAWTKGPWSISGRGAYRAQISGSGWVQLAKVVVRLRGMETDSVEGLANARLMAAAPSLADAARPIVEELTAFVGRIDEPDHVKIGVRVGDLRALAAALKLATGG